MSLDEVRAGRQCSVGDVLRGEAAAHQVAVLHFDSLQADGGRDSPVERVVLVEIGPDTEDGRPVVRDGVQPHDLGEAHVLVLVERAGVRALEGVVHGDGCSSTVVDVAGVTGGRPWTSILYQVLQWTWL